MSVVARLFGFMFLLAFAGLVAAYFAWGELNRDGPSRAAVTVDIPRGTSTEEIARRLEDGGVVRSKAFTTLALLAMRYGLGGEARAGEYEFAAAAPLVDVLRKLKRGAAITYKVTIPEGFTTARVLERLAAHEVLTGNVTDEPAEGELLPDTYVFSRGKTRQQVIDQMRKAQARLMDELWPKRAADLPFDTPREAIILASIVEKETGIAEERPRVAAVFINRLRRNMRLQSDPTIIYGITGGRDRLDRPIYRSDIDQKTPYNTYQIDGLPPGPIANPGRESIKAVLNPIQTDDLYFVADGTGGHVFARTLAEHNANVRKWRAWQREQRRNEAEAEAEARAEAAAEAAAGQDEQAQPAPDPAPEPAQGQAASSPEQTGSTAPAADGDAAPEADRPAPQESGSSFRVVEVDGRFVPIPRARPRRQ